MNVTVGYTIYNKAFLMEKIVKGVAKLDGVNSLFLFDACTDDSLRVFMENAHKLKNFRVFLNPGYDLFETRSNNFILNNFEDDYCLLFQDDLVITNGDFLRLAEKIYHEDLTAGLIGFKDGYEMEITNQYKEMISSPWSASRYRNQILNPGEYLTRTFVNRGPLCVPRKLIEKTGVFDESFYPLFWDDNDLSMRSRRAGFNNYVAYADMDTDTSWGATRSNSKLPLKDIYLANQIRFAKKWDTPLARVSRFKSLKAIFRSRHLHFRQRLFSPDRQKVIEIKI